MTDENLVAEMAQAICQAYHDATRPEILQGFAAEAAARAALSVVREAEGWRPIETAPAADDRGRAK